MPEALTGHVGARRNLKVALVTDDFRLYHRVVPFFEGRGLRVLGLRPGDPVPPGVGVVLAGPPGDARSVPLRPSLEATLLAALQALDERRSVRQAGAYQRVVFGIDPGQVIGLAVLADDEPLLAAEARGAEEAVARLAAWRTGLAADRWEVHVGDGDPPVGRDLLEVLSRRLPDVARSLVPEEATTPFRARTGSRHADAAIHIARREPG